MKMLRPKDVEKEYGIKKKTLERWREKNYGPPFSRVGGRIILYDRNKLERWLNKFEVIPTAKRSF